MFLPLYKFGAFGMEASLIVALLIGIAFGFVLERAGFGSCRKLASQFYFRDLAVFKVMFTAIVTAMLGVYLLSVMGVLDITLIYKTPTIIWPQVVGGLILGIGFVIGGYCPGTSVAALGSGKIDALTFIGGVMLGLFAYGEIFPSIESWARPEGTKVMTLPEITGVSYGIIVLAVVLMAVGGFMAAEWAEAKYGDKKAGKGSLTGDSSLVTPARAIVAMLLFLGIASLFLGSPYAGRRVNIDTKELALITANKANYITPESLADAIIKGDTDFVIYHLYSSEEDKPNNITDGKTIGSTNLKIASPEFEALPRTENIILYSQDGTEAAQALIILKAKGYPSVRVLKGGFNAWLSDVLYPSKPTDTSKAAQQAFAKKVVVAKHFGGKASDSSDASKVKKAPVIAPPSITPPTGGKRKRPSREGC